MNGVLVTARGNIAMANGLVSLSDMWHNAGKNKIGNEPVAWAKEHNLSVFGDDNEVFAEQKTALAYAWHLSPSLGGTLESQLNKANSPLEYCADEKLSATADKSRDMFLSALKKAGITDSKDFSKLTNLLYLSTLNTSTASLRHAYKACDRSVRKSLDTAALAKVMSTEINVCSAIYIDQLKGYADVAHKIKQHGELVQIMYRPKTH